MKRIFVSLLLALAFSVSVASADYIVIDPSTAFPGSSYAGAFFDHPSWDGPGCTVGNYISGSGNCTRSDFYNGSPSAVLPFLGTGQTAFSFVAAPNTPVFLSGISSHVDEFGWFEAGIGALREGSRKGPVYNKLFSNTDPLNTAASFTPAGIYGFYFLDTATGVRHRTDTFGTDQQSHFALFAAPNGTYYMGMEDLNGPLGATDFDYNDAIVKFTPQPVPEPASMLLLGTGLISLGAAFRRKRANK